MVEDLIIAGFGGQGVMSVGQLLAYSGLHEEKNVLWVPAYGPETRGGFANCTVIISDEEIGSPVVSHPKSIIVLNLPSLDRFEDSLAPGGTLIVNSSLIERDVRRNDINVIRVKATEIATEVGDQRVANMVTLGALLESKNLVSRESVMMALKKKFAGKDHVIALNEKAFDMGREEARKQLTAAK